MLCKDAKGCCVLALGAVMVSALVVDLSVGPLSWSRLWHGLWQGDPLAWQVVGTLRLPRVLLAAGVGGLLAWAGAVMQSLFRNPLADPGLIGVSASAGLGAVLLIALTAASVSMQMLAAFVMAGGVLWGLYRLGTRHGVTDLAWLLLAGIAINAMASSGIGLSLYLSSDEALRRVTWWLLGSFSAASWLMVGLVFTGLFVCVAATPWLTRALDAWWLGESSAWQVGVAVQRIKLLSLALVALAAALAVATSGMIGFVGLVGPHVARLLLGPGHRWLLPGAVLAGMSLTLLADAAAHALLAPGELPVGLMLSALGGPFFFALLMRLRRV
ncbi:FecCD family ABC transporter permease [Sulfurivirga caldicuralii]|uniref:FecCD family ABC transporter permease n=1 Tax=Sulfurivirga caldicuralii TaxID=364032 RepID=UPI0013566C8A|nr:iron ABC transporter permease [Sulfurivirga caldicuralii]